MLTELTRAAIAVVLVIALYGVTAIGVVVARVRRDPNFPSPPL